MFWQTRQAIFSKSWVNSILDEALGATTVPFTIDSALVKLFTSALNPDPNTPLATFTAAEATFGGYAAVTISPWTGPVNLSANIQAGLGSANFLGTDPITTPENIHGYWVEDPGGTEWIFAEQFDVAFPITNPGDFLDIDLIYPWRLFQSTGQV